MGNPPSVVNVGLIAHATDKHHAIEWGLEDMRKECRLLAKPTAFASTGLNVYLQEMDQKENLDYFIKEDDGDSEICVFEMPGGREA